MPKHPAQAAGERSAQHVKELEARVAELEAERLRLRLVIENGISGAENLPAFGDGPGGFLHDEWLPDARHALKGNSLDH